MEKPTAKVFVTGRSQAIRIPKQYRFTTDEVYIEQDGERIILSPKPKSWAQYFTSAKHFTKDYPDHIEDLIPEERELFV
ncbi:MAG: AbrB/MazE/SpoVT family DNA-binding domain-containing protein [Desulfobulbaceae bacterium]|nr:AbrB/MazE/SpoVT family DNA-binding domain-containing protein [Desulfobulbaceae bacterium]